MSSFPIVLPGLGDTYAEGSRNGLPYTVEQVLRNEVRLKSKLSGYQFWVPVSRLHDGTYVKTKREIPAQSRPTKKLRGAVV